MVQNKGFIFLGDKIKLPEKIQEIEIIHNYFLKKASRQQVDIIKSKLSSTGNQDFCIRNFESKYQIIDGVVHYHPSPSLKDWNYWIVEHNERQAKFNVKLALLLSTCDLFSLFENLTNIGKIYEKFSYQNFIVENTFKFNIKELSRNDITEIQDIYGLLENFNKVEYKYIDKALKDYCQLRSIPSNSSLFILGMFSILEALLVHNSQVVPITHQIKTKLNLLNNRFDYPINFQELFGEVKYEKVISKLYEFRSDIAHGDFSDFNGELQILGNSERVLSVIHKILKATLKQALKEPQLIKDLKNC